MQCLDLLAGHCSSYCCSLLSLVARRSLVERIKLIKRWRRFDDGTDRISRPSPAAFPDNRFARWKCIDARRHSRYRPIVY